MQRSLPFLFAFVSAFTCSFSLRADNIFLDNTFSDPTWVPTIVLQSGSVAASGAQTNYNGNDFLRLTVGNNVNHSGVAVYCHNSTFSYTPATQGAISSLDYLVQLMAISSVNSARVAFASPMVRQNNTNYAATAFSSSETNWMPFAAGSLPADAFGALLVNSGAIIVNGSLHPDFSSSGAPLTFGFCSVLNTVSGGGNSATFGLDEVLIFVRSVRQQPSLGIVTIAGVVITGITNHTYLVEYATAVAPQNWQTLTNIVMPASPFTVYDEQSTSAAQRFYRATDVTP
jgi:hypothetical protein